MPAEKGAPSYLPCTKCQKTAAVVQPGKVDGFTKRAISAAMGAIGADAPAELGTGAAGLVFGIPAGALARMLNLQCPRCYLESSAADQAGGAHGE